MRELLRLTRNPSGNGSVFTCKISRPLNQPCESPSVAMPAFLFVEKNVFLFFSSFFGRKKNLITGGLLPFWNAYRVWVLQCSFLWVYIFACISIFLFLSDSQLFWMQSLLAQNEKLGRDARVACL